MIKNQAHVRYDAAEYDTFTRDFVAPFDAAFAEIVAAELRKREPQPVLLDIGTGTARFPIYLVSSGNAGDAVILASDFFDDMIEQARLAIQEAGITAIQVRHDDVHDIALPEAAADVVISRSTLHHWHSPAKALAEIYRVLKPGGIGLILDVRRDAPADAVQAFNDRRATAGLPPSFLDEKYTPAEAMAFCAEAGIAEFANVYAQDSGDYAIGMTLVISKKRNASPTAH